MSHEFDPSSSGCVGCKKSFCKECGDCRTSECSFYDRGHHVGGAVSRTTDKRESRGSISEFERQQGYVVKDSGQRTKFSSGMVRDKSEDKPNYILALDGPMFERYAIHMTKGAKKYSARNWMKADGQAELDHAWASLSRHFFQYVRGDQDEDHAAAIIFNLNLIEYIKERSRP